MTDQIQIIDNGDAVYIDVNSISYSNGVIGGPQRITLSRDIGGKDPRTVNVTISVTTEVEREIPFKQTVEEVDTVDASLQLR